MKEGLVSCEECERKYTNQTSLKYHKFSQHNQKPLCDQCNEEFPSYHKYIEHRQVKHKVNPVIETEENNYKECDECKKKILSKNMSRHLNEHHRITNVNLTAPGAPKVPLYNQVCDICGKKFIRSDMLANHKRSEHLDDPLLCDRCDKKFVRRSELNRHMNEVHLEGGTHSCPRCATTFGKKSNMKRHYAGCKVAQD